MDCSPFLSLIDRRSPAQPSSKGSHERHLPRMSAPPPSPLSPFPLLFPPSPYPPAPSPPYPTPSRDAATSTKAGHRSGQYFLHALRQLIVPIRSSQPATLVLWRDIEKIRKRTSKQDVHVQARSVHAKPTTCMPRRPRCMTLPVLAS